jgi:hypothetical protein
MNDAMCGVKQADMSGKTTDCYIDVWRDAGFEGEAIRIEGPAEHPNLEFSNGDWGDRIGSLRVGPHAFVLAYRDKDFKDAMVAFGPGQEVANLEELDFDDDIDSIKVIDSLKILDYRPAEIEAGTVGAAGNRTGAGSGSQEQHHRKRKNHHKGRRR